MVGQLLLRGMIIGIIAGLLAFGFAKAFGEPQVDGAIAFEDQQNEAKGEVPEPEIISRPTQAGIGLLTGVVTYGAAVGGLFSLVFAFVHGRAGRLGARATAGLIALGGFIAVVLVPFVKYPANPPSVGDPDTISMRTELFFVMLVLSVAALTLAVVLARRLAARHGAWNAALIGGAAFIVVIAAVQLALPSINEVPEQFSAVLLWRFRIASLGIQLVLWTTIGLVFGAMAERVFGERPARRSSPLRPVTG